MTKYNLFNPYTARRVVHSGVAGSKAIEILPRQSAENVELADHIAEELMARHEADPVNEIRVDIASEEPKREAMKIKVDDSKIDVVKGKR